MKRILHILTKASDPLVDDLIRLQREQGEGDIVVVDLNQSSADYAALLEAIFAADSVEVW